MSGLLAVAALDGLDGALWAALRALAADPATTEVPRRPLDALDLLGTAVGIAAIRRGATRAQVRALLRRVSNVDAVLDRIAVAGAEARYRRVLEAVAELEALAVGDEGIHRFLTRDDTVVARMAAAADVAEAAGLDVAGDAHLPRAVRWQRHGFGRLGPVSDLHRACGADIVRGSLRLWSQAGGSPRGDSR
jgi:hypothetical protein